MTDQHESERRHDAPTRSGQQLTNVVVGLLAAAFMAWAGVVWRGTESIAGKMELLSQQIYAYQIRMEARMTTVEQRQNGLLECCASYREGRP